LRHFALKDEKGLGSCHAGTCKLWSNEYNSASLQLRSLNIESNYQGSLLCTCLLIGVNVEWKVLVGVMLLLALSL